ncbi:MAG TPA: TadE/TadG family type IV pilus assembly protein [Nevskiaceae bacterium]|nr:TadE/TadG family type IV pilus assembly protein [Nevskiaceae bacterium]
MLEFAFTFPILFLLMYGVIAFSYIFVLKESITYAAQEAAESAVAVRPQDDRVAFDAQVITRARSVAASSLSWLPQRQRERVVGDASGSKVAVSFCENGAASGTLPAGVSCPAEGSAVVVRLVFDLETNGANQLFPVVRMPLIGPVPPLPQALSAVAVARL